MVFTNVINPRSHVSRKDEYKPTLVRRGASIGANATVVCGIEIGSYAFIGAGAVVTGNVRPFALMVGVPARQAGWVCQCGVILERGMKGGDGRRSLRCAVCGTAYTLEAGVLTMDEPA